MKMKICYPGRATVDIYIKTCFSVFKEVKFAPEVICDSMAKQ